MIRHKKNQKTNTLKESEERKKLVIYSKSNVSSKNNGKLGSYNQGDIKIVLTLTVGPFSQWIQLACQTEAKKRLQMLV